MTFLEFEIAILYFLIGLIISALIKKAENKRIIDGTNKYYTTNGKMIYFLVFILLEIFLLAQPLRYGMLAYEPVFRNSTSYNANFFSINGLYRDEMEPLFLLWCYLVRCITPNYTVFLAVSYGIVIYSVLKFISNYSENKYKAYTFLLYWPVMIDFIFGIRYALGCGYSLLALVALKEKKWIKFSILCIVAAFTHFLLFAFILFVGYYFVITKTEKKNIFSLKTIVLSLIGVYIFSKVAFSIYSTFRVSYRVMDNVSLRNIISYLPQVIIAVMIWYYNRNAKPDKNKGVLILCTYFNMVMIPITIQWGIYRLPYVFFLPMSVAVSNYIRPTKDKNIIMYYLIVLMFYAYSLTKIITMGIQNASLIF